MRAMGTKFLTCMFGATLDEDGMESESLFESPSYSIKPEKIFFKGFRNQKDVELTVHVGDEMVVIKTLFKLRK